MDGLLATFVARLKSDGDDRGRAAQVEAAKALQTATSAAKAAQLVANRDALLFPLVAALRLPRRIVPVQTKEVVVQVLADIVSRAWPAEDVTSFVHLLRHVLDALDGVDQENAGGAAPSEIKDGLEELYAGLIATLHGLFEAARPDTKVFAAVNSDALRVPVGHTTSTLIRFAVDKTGILGLGTRRAALDALLLIADRLDTASMVHVVPGLSHAVWNVVAGAGLSVSVHHSLVVRAVDLWRKVLVKTFADGLAFEEEAEDAGQISVPRTRDWLERATENVRLLLQRIAPLLLDHASSDVRMAAVDFAGVLLTECGHNMRRAAMDLIDWIVGAVVDGDVHVADVCHGWLDRLAIVIDRQDRWLDGRSAAAGHDLPSLLVDALRAAIVALPRVFVAPDDAPKLRALARLTGYVRLLDQAGVLDDPDLLRKVVHRLLAVLVLQGDVTRTAAFEWAQPEARAGAEESFGGRTGDFLAVAAIRRFANFTDHVVAARAVRRLMGTLARPVVVDALLTVLRDASLPRLHAPAALLLCDALRGEDVPRERADLVLDEIVELWTMRSELEDEDGEEEDDRRDDAPDAAAAAAPRHVGHLTDAFLLEAVANAARVVEDEMFGRLQDILFHVLDKASDKRAIVNQAAVDCLRVLAPLCGYRTVAALMADSTDYLVDALRRFARALDRHPRAVRVLRSVIRHASAETIELFDDIQATVLDGLDGFRDALSYDFLGLLLDFCRVVASRYQGTDAAARRQGESDDGDDEVEASGVEEEEFMSMDALRSYFENYHADKARAEADGTAAANEARELDDADEETAAPSGDQALVLRVLEKCQHFLAERSIGSQLLVLDIIETCLPTLASVPTHYRPVIHKQWPNLIALLGHERDAVVLHVLGSLRSISAYCGRDFMRRRVLADLWPALQSIVDRRLLAAFHAKRRDGHLDRWTNASPAEQAGPLFRLHLSVLETLARVAPLVDVHEVAAATYMFLHVHQPVRVRVAGEQLFRALARVDADALWLLWAEMCQMDLGPPVSLPHALGHDRRAAYPIYLTAEADVSVAAPYKQAAEALASSFILTTPAS